MAISKVVRELGEEAQAAAFHIDSVQFAGDSAYPTGGTPAFSQAIGIAPGHLFAVIPVSHGGYIFDYDRGVDKLKVYQQPAAAAAGAMPEVPNTTNLSAVTFRALIFYT